MIYMDQDKMNKANKITILDRALANNFRIKMMKIFGIQVVIMNNKKMTSIKIFQIIQDKINFRITRYNNNKKSNTMKINWKMYIIDQIYTVMEINIELHH